MTVPESLRSTTDDAVGIDLTVRRDEQILAERVRGGDPVAFEAIFRRYHRELRAIAEGVVGSRAAAEDVVQDVFLAVWTSRTRWRITTSLGAYLHRSVRNAALRRASRRGDRVVSINGAAESPGHAAQRPGPFVSPGPSPLDHAEHAAMAADVARAAAALPPRAREVFALSRNDQLTHREIAERLTLSPKTVEMHLTRALAALRSALAPWR